MKHVKLYEEFLNDDEKIQEDFAVVGTPPGGNVIGMGSVTAPTPGHLGSGDTWPALGTPAVPVQVNSPICPICKKSKKTCTCADSPSEKKKKKIKKIKLEEMKHVTKLQDFLKESKNHPDDWMEYMKEVEKGLSENKPLSPFTIDKIVAGDAESDDMKGDGWGEGSFVLKPSPVSIDFEYDIKFVKIHGDETADIKIVFDFHVADANRTLTYKHDLKKQSVPDLAKKLKTLVQEDLYQLSKEY